MAVYLLHFVDSTGKSTRYKHAAHYLGSSANLPARLAAHRAGEGARLIEVIQAHGITWVLARTWEGGRDVEAQLKRWRGSVKLCPICAQERVAAQLRLQAIEQQGKPGLFD